MARRTRSSFLENRTARLKLATRKKPYTALIAPGIFLAYRRNTGPGTWSVKCHGWLKRFGLADDHEDANGESVMSYWQALERAKMLARAGEANTEQPISVAETINAYEADLETRGGRKYNATQLRLHLTDALKSKAVALLTERELRDWRAGLVKAGLKPSSADRIGRSLKAALALAARNDKRITNAAAWKNGVRKLPDSEVARNVILPDQTVAALVTGSYDEDRDFGLLIDVLAETGARESQVFKLTPADLQDHLNAARLMMPTSRKGKNRTIEYRPLPISTRLAKALRKQVAGRAAHDSLFAKMWNLAASFRPVVESLGLGPEVTPYALRHCSIVRHLLKGVPTRVVAAHHDTSVAMIEKNYSRYIIGDPSESLTRAALLDLETSVTSSTRCRAA
ncbi:MULTISPECIES: tyrosine-type recombinase/integrase [unclassified Bradyrhizobium]|uniref:tyrosine-type recombinase/integrase n=1 Tax=unclassified Bradyrhizobium TaxID=2631580 RepID=UPI001FFAAC0B|nr:MULTISPECIES: tyrosine-type recombinase/integrase [unclassified Bradyrhizobium]MCK1321053.1 tyrosine-type recombinase/integrase [Bradyrhizobium sp. 156]MCK1412560.1 tyrosine-type recombinase/integrase [Bradyrhizobium sp. CW4]UPJ99114.1 tyrosine-type recombinase/integrase [Bradyrhizobium sp. 172]